MDFFLKNGRFCGRIWPDWGNTTWADMAGLGSIGLIFDMLVLLDCLGNFCAGGHPNVQFLLVLSPGLVLG